MADNSDLQKIQASEKPTSDDFEYAYVETVNKAFVRIAKERLKEILGANRYTNEEIDQKLSTIPKFNIEVVSSLPTTDISETTIYLVSSGDDSENLYTEYININGLWEILGTQKSTFSGSAKDVTYDDTETKLGATNVQDAFGKLSATIKNLATSGMTTEQIDLLDAIGDYIPFKSAEGGAKWDELIASLRGGSSGGEEPDTPTEATLSSISATYNGGEVTTGTELSSLTGITVTATYSDGTTKTVTGYTLSGEILEGENTITVTYGGKTTTITVTGIVESGGDATAELNSNGLVFDFDFRNVSMEAYNLSGWGNVYKTTDKTNTAMIFGGGGAVGDEIGLENYNFRQNRLVDNETTQIKLGTSYTVQALYKKNSEGVKIQPALFTWGTNVVSDNEIWILPKYLVGSTETTVSNDNKVTVGKPEYACVTYVVDGNILNIYFNEDIIYTFDGADYEGFTQWVDYGVPNSIYNRAYMVSFVGYNRTLTNAEVIDNVAYFKTLEVA